jgi:wyosine [tRNA(Phe)-imidazoG37] synthetase (radical SAM superfamily)
MMMIAFGPVPSRRLGKSLGINNIPPKICTYSCVYCQVGRTIRLALDRREFYQWEKIIEDVGIKIENALANGEHIDYLTFVPDGEPTLDINLGREIEALGRFGFKTAVITNASLLWRDDVREDLLGADLVSVKVDSIREDIWRKINRPHPRLKLENILKGILAFSRVYEGDLITETMLVKDMNDDESHVVDVARFLSEVKPASVYLAIPTRPPAVSGTQVPDEAVINSSYQLFSQHLEHVEYLIGYEGDAFAYTGQVEDDILSISAVHPMREDAIRKLLSRSDTGWELIKKLTAEGKLKEIEYRGEHFYLRKIG